MLNPNAKFKVGDKVFVVRRISREGIGWSNYTDHTHIEPMDSTIGKKYTIVAFCHDFNSESQNYTLDNNWTYPEECLSFKSKIPESKWKGIWKD